MENDFSRRSDEDLLRIVLQSENKASEILKKVSLENLDAAHRNELDLTYKGFGRLQASIELGRRIQELKTAYKSFCVITSSSDAISYCQNQFSRLIFEGLQEEFHIVTLNTKNKVIDNHLITIGTLDASLVHPREVFRRAIKDAASSVILFHNHPSKDPTPSEEDIAVTNRLSGVGETIGIHILDHIVGGTPNPVSIREYA